MPNDNFSNKSWKSTQAAQAAKSAPDLRAKFQLPPQPANVAKIAGLVRGRESASMEEITEIISSESGVTQRLMTLAYPRQQARLGATVQMATSRLGVNRVIVVMVGDLLTKAVLETFETMVAMALEMEEAPSLSMADHGFLTGSVTFAGETTGQVSLSFSPYLSLIIAGQLLGGNLDDEHPPEAINDVIGELVNIVTGNLQSKLCDAGLTSEVGLPQVVFQAALPKESVAGGSIDHFFFSHGIHKLAVSLSIDPSAPAAPAKPAPRAPSTHGTGWRANGY
jgi:CheY-specific phosphatase CheX